jgi:hypothetical protein
MPDVLTFSRSVSESIGNELLEDITGIRDGLSQTLPWTPDVAVKFSRLADIAKTAQLRSLQRALLALTDSARRLTEQPSTAVLTQSILFTQAVLTYMKEWLREHKNTPLRLAKPLQQLNLALGSVNSPMLHAEMFIPFRPENCTSPRPSEISSDSFNASVREHLNVYQRCLLKLIKENDLEQINVMRQALVTLEPKNPYPGYRVFFESAIATFDILQNVGSLDNSTKWLVGRISPDLNMITQGRIQSDDNLLSALLYFIAKADSGTSARVRNLQDRYSLQSFIADINTVSPDIIEKFLSVLVKARDMWNAQTQLSTMLAMISDLKAKAGHLHNPGFVITLCALHAVLEAVVSKTVLIDENVLALEGASALVLMEMQVREGSEETIANQFASKMYQLIGIQSSVVDSTSRKNSSLILHQLASEILNDLDPLESRLLEMLNGNTECEAELRHGLVKIYKILRILGKSNALSMAFKVFEGDLCIQDSDDGRRDLAGQYEQLCGLVDHLKTSESSAFTAAQRWLDSRPKSISNVPVVIEDDVDIPNDSELLEIFLEEAESIIIDVTAGLNILRSDLSAHDVLLHIRRGFHTLKGSGRMVGLSHFGDMSSVTESLLNNWIQRKISTSLELIKYLDDATALALVHITNFKVIGSSKIQFEDLEVRATALGGASSIEAPMKKNNVSSDEIAISSPAIKIVNTQGAIKETPSAASLVRNIAVPSDVLDLPIARVDAPTVVAKPVSPILPVILTEVLTSDVDVDVDAIVKSMDKFSLVDVEEAFIDVAVDDTPLSILSTDAEAIHPALRSNPLLEEWQKPLVPLFSDQAPFVEVESNLDRSIEPLVSELKPEIGPLTSESITVATPTSKNAATDWARRQTREAPASWKKSSVGIDSVELSSIPSTPERVGVETLLKPDNSSEKAEKKGFWGGAKLWVDRFYTSDK